MTKLSDGARNAIMACAATYRINGLAKIADELDALLAYSPAPATTTMKPDLLHEAAELIEYATFHDGRYDQMASVNWQETAQKLVTRMGVALNRKPYEQFRSKQ